MKTWSGCYGELHFHQTLVVSTQKTSARLTFEKTSSGSILSLKTRLIKGQFWTPQVFVYMIPHLPLRKVIYMKKQKLMHVNFEESNTRIWVRGPQTNVDNVDSVKQEWTMLGDHYIFCWWKKGEDLVQYNMSQTLSIWDNYLVEFVCHGICPSICLVGKKTKLKSWSPRICGRPISWRWALQKLRETMKPYP